MKKSFAKLLFDNSYVKLPNSFYEKIHPTPVKNPDLIQLNETLVAEFGLDIKELKSKKGVDFFSGNYIPETSEPIASVYAGHQFGHFVPQLGDGRAILLGEIINKNGQRFDIQLKGSGKTSFSRKGDGRSALGPVIREYIMSEAMYALGIKTTRALAAVTTGENVYRENILPGGIFTRIASSHIRVGTFQYFAAINDLKSVKKLANYTINRHYKKCEKATNPYLDLLKSVIDAQAQLISSWMMKGFIHGVMNTDNTSICGETIDYGPCAFMDNYDANKTFSSIDLYQRYSFKNQANIAKWNLTCFAQSIISLIDSDMNKAIDIAQNELDNFSKIFNKYWLDGMKKKFGLFKNDQNDLILIQDFLSLMQKYQADYTLSFQYLSFIDNDNCDNKNMKELFSNSTDYKNWELRFKERLKSESKSQKIRLQTMQFANPIFIPRNHLMEEAIKEGVEDNRFTKMSKLLKILKDPYKPRNNDNYYKLPPKIIDHNYKTFCGT
ncbi:YdiU family protein [Rickettsiales bacterium]|nr:YdiU family protein [Rickettsiales bacterium]